MADVGTDAGGNVDPSCCGVIDDADVTDADLGVADDGAGMNEDCPDTLAFVGFSVAFPPGINDDRDDDSEDDDDDDNDESLAGTCACDDEPFARDVSSMVDAPPAGPAPFFPIADV
jgi:hypothetical protein